MPDSYKITDSDSGDSFVGSFDKEPSQEEIDKIFELRKKTKQQGKESLAQADQASKLFTWPNVKQAGLDVGKSLIDPQNILAAGIIGTNPELAPIVGGAYGAQALKRAYETYRNPTEENKIGLVGDIAQTALPFLGGKLGRMKIEDISNQPRPVVNVPPSEVNPNIVNVNKGISNMATGTMNALNKPFTIDPSKLPVPVNPIQAEFVPTTEWTKRYPIVTPPPTRTQITTSEQLALPPKGPIITPPPSEQLALPPAPTGPIVTPPPKPVAGLLKGRISRAGKSKLISPEEKKISQEQQITSHEISPKKIEQKPIENSWIREQDDSVLKAMREGSKGKLREEIDTVLGERNLLPTKTSEIKNEEGSKLNEEIFNKYNNQLESLVSQDNVPHETLKTISQLGKDAGLDQDTIVQDLIDNMPRVSNASNKAYAAINKIFKTLPKD